MNVRSVTAHIWEDQCIEEGCCKVRNVLLFTLFKITKFRDDFLIIYRNWSNWNINHGKIVRVSVILIGLSLGLGLLVGLGFGSM